MNRPVPTLLLILSTLALVACGPRGSFPSLQPRPGEIPRVIEEPGAGADMRLPPEQQKSLKADLAREGKALADTQAEVARNKAALDKALANAKGKPRGSEPWSDAQMALSRFDLARAPFGEIEARMTPLLRMVDSLDSEDPDRQAVENLATAATRASADAERRVQTAGAALAL